MFAPMTAADVPAMVGLAVATGMFPPEAGGFLTEIAEAVLSGARPGAWTVARDGDAVLAVAFVEPREATDRTWAVTMLAVAPDRQGAGVGSALLAHVEAALRAEDQRLLVIETSGTAAYAATRAFYSRCGCRAVARVPDYFEDGDDMVLFHKDLRV